MFGRTAGTTAALPSSNAESSHTRRNPELLTPGLQSQYTGGPTMAVEFSAQVMRGATVITSFDLRDAYAVISLDYVIVDLDTDVGVRGAYLAVTQRLGELKILLFERSDP